jgi:type IV secretion system protein VirB8
MSERGIDIASVETQKGPESRYFSEAVRWKNDVIRLVKRSPASWRGSLLGSAPF